MKKKVLIGLIIVIVFVLLGIGIFVFVDKKSKDKEFPKEEIRLDVKEKLILEYGSEIPKFSSFCSYEGLEDVKIEIYFDGKLYEEDSLKELGEYKVKIIVKDETYDSIIIVEDNEGPLLELKDVVIDQGDKYDLKDFVLKCEDNTGEECLLEFATEEMKSYTESGIYDISIVAKDSSGNVTKIETKLIINKKEDKKTESSKNTSSNKSTSNKNTSSKDNDTSKVEPVVTYKYGVKITTIGNKTTYDRTTFNATTNDLKDEALQQKSKEQNNINQILSETNKYRTELGIEPLTLDDTMTTAANIRALEMAWGNKTSHTRPDGRDCFSILDEFNVFYFSSGENIARGQKNGSTAASWWRNSPGHYANMTNKYFTKIGIGVYKFNGQYYYVQLFTN